MLTSPAIANRRSPQEQAGFTLVELLIVMSVILIIITLAIPSYEHVHIKANETSAIASVRMLNSMETEYNSSFPSHGFACSLATLGGKQSAGAGTAEAAGLIPEDLASGSKAGYNFTVSNCAKNTVNNVDQYNSYQITATPVNVGKTGNRTFCSDETGQIRFDPKGGTNCTEILQ
ncbi:MAG TPA: prepilin-type N-terminal cleavage/methylation domain-containing protein [Acidobacteriaceae bacterium]|nr:prepilin-type N-terminal cleavage/methylation domain-containing protein [Acidobacteriaceae bacterium]